MPLSNIRPATSVFHADDAAAISAFKRLAETREPVGSGLISRTAQSYSEAISPAEAGFRGFMEDRDEFLEALRQNPFLVEFAERRLGLAFDDEAFLRQMNLMAHGLLNSARSQSVVLTPDEKRFLIEYANANVSNKRDRCFARRAFATFHDFAGLRSIVDSIGDRSHRDWQLAVHDLEYFDALEIPESDLRNIQDGALFFWGSFFTAFEMAMRERSRTFAASRGCRKFDQNAFSQIQLARDLTILSRSYDLVVPVARAGLFSGAMAEVLGLKTLVIDVKAHNRKRPRSRFIDKAGQEDIEGRRILLLDDDVVTGASVREAVRLLRPYKPASIGVYLNHSTETYSKREAVAGLEGLGIAVHHAANMPDTPYLPSVYLLHERMNTTLGRLRNALRSFREIFIVNGARGEVMDAVREFIRSQEELYFSINHFLPGAEEVRRYIVSRLEGIINLYMDNRAFNEVLSPGADRSVGSASLYAMRLIKADSLLPYGTAEYLARGRYIEMGSRLAEQRGVKNEHIPHSYVASFRTALKAAADGYDAALIVGPEGFAYEPIFAELGLRTVAINIPEADFDGERTLTALDKLSGLKGKRVLVVEDDVRSGATLRKILEMFKRRMPSHLGLYLGTDMARQYLENIPAEFKSRYVATGSSDGDIEFLRHLDKREVLFKRDPQLWRRRIGLD